jgi:hypothetical protein
MYRPWMVAHTLEDKRLPSITPAIRHQSLAGLCVAAASKASAGTAAMPLHPPPPQHRLCLLRPLAPTVALTANCLLISSGRRQLVMERRTTSSTDRLCSCQAQAAAAAAVDSLLAFSPRDGAAGVRLHCSRQQHRRDRQRHARRVPMHS